jgi:hypothetical protein
MQTFLLLALSLTSRDKIGDPSFRSDQKVEAPAPCSSAAALFDTHRPMAGGPSACGLPGCECTNCDCSQNRNCAARRAVGAATSEGSFRTLEAKIDDLARSVASRADMVALEQRVDSVIADVEALKRAKATTPPPTARTDSRLITYKCPCGHVGRIYPSPGDETRHHCPACDKDIIVHTSQAPVQRYAPVQQSAPRIVVDSPGPFTVGPMDFGAPIGSGCPSGLCGMPSFGGFSAISGGRPMLGGFGGGCAGGSCR